MTDTPTAPLPHAVLAEVLCSRGSSLTQWAGLLRVSGMFSPWQHERIRRDLAEIEAALQAYERQTEAARNLGCQDSGQRIEKPLRGV